MTEIVLFHVLAATAGAAVGLLAIWAGLGRLHWSMRFIPVVAVIVVLFPVPAFDLALVFVSQALVVTVPLIFVRRFRRPPADETSTANPQTSHAWRRFSVADLFRATLLIAAVFGVVAYLPGDVRASWWKYVLLGAGFGVATLAGAWAALARRRWWIRLAVVCVVAPLAGVPTALDRYTYSFSREWPWPWCAVTAAVAALVAVWLSLARTARPTSIRSRVPPQVASDAALHIPRSVRSWLAWMGVGTALLAILLLPTLAFHDMLHPAPIPIEPLPEPNAYHDLLQVADALVEIALNGASTEDAKQTTQAQQRRALLDEAHALLRRQCGVPIRYDDKNQLNEIQAFRQLGRDLQADGNGLATAGDTAAAERSYLDLLELGLASSQGGLGNHRSFGRALAGMGIEGLRKLRGTLSPDQRRTLITNLQAHESRWEPLAVVYPRDLAWLHRSFGWPARISFASSVWKYQGVEEKYDQLRPAILRLLVCELALAQYIADHGGPPEDLAGLVPRHLPEVPEDAYCGRPLVYRTEAPGYVLYSVGPNGVDDGGQRGTSFTDGDWFLDPVAPSASDGVTHPDKSRVTRP